MKQHPTIRVVAAVLSRPAENLLGDAPHVEYLITQRRPAAALPLLWEFPGGRVEEGESDAQALEREVRYRLGVDVEVGQLISYVRHPYDGYTVDLHLYPAKIVRGELRAQAVHAFRWVRSTEFDSYEFTPADESSMAELLGLPVR